MLSGICSLDYTIPEIGNVSWQIAMLSVHSPSKPDCNLFNQEEEDFTFNVKVIYCKKKEHKAR